MVHLVEVAAEAEAAVVAVDRIIKTTYALLRYKVTHSNGLQRPRHGNNNNQHDSTQVRAYFKPSFFEDPWRHLS